jgi:hypothetical protein
VVRLRSGKVFIVEVKPKAQLQKPEPPKRKTPKSVKNFQWLYETWVINMCKKASAEEFANSKGWSYLLVTEDFFKVRTA